VKRFVGGGPSRGAGGCATYLNFVPAKNDGKTVYKMTVKDVPVEGFLSVSLYNEQGFYEKNELGAYTLNNVTSKKNADGSVNIQFGGCDRRASVPFVRNVMRGPGRRAVMVQNQSPRSSPVGI
jgi:hypothetical protein